MEDIIAHFKEACEKGGNMMKDLIARFKKAWAAFVRTWKFEKDAGEMTKRVREEVEYAIDCERKEAIEENDDTFLDYIIECYRSASRAYETMAADGHSGMSWSLTRQILARLAEGKPLKGLNSYQDRPEEWGERRHWIVDDGAVLINIRYPALSYRVNASGKEIYHDIDRWVFEAPDCPNIPWHNGFLSNYLDEKFPIQFPYYPVTVHVRVEEILTDPAHGDFDAQRIIDFVDPETGKTVGVDACFEEVDGKWQKIGKKKWYALRKKHWERIAAALRAKEN